MAIKVAKYKAGDDFPRIRDELNHLSGSNTLSFAYKAGDSQSQFSTNGGVHLCIAKDGGMVFNDDADTFSVSFDSTEITITWHSLIFRPTNIDNLMFIFNAFAKPSEGLTHYRYVATSGQTTFSGADADGNTLSYDVEDGVQVFQNGVYVPQTDYTATSLTSIVLNSGATASDNITIWALAALVDQTSLSEVLTTANNASSTATTAATNASNAEEDAEKWANHNFNTLFTLSDGVTTGYSAKSRTTDAKNYAEADINTTFGTTGENTSTHYSAKHYANQASNSATSASTSATSATNEAAAAAASASAAQNSLDSFEAIYLGASATDPTTDLNGDPLTVGDQYFNSTSNTLFVYTGSSWEAMPASNLAGLSDVDNSLSPSGNEVLQYDGQEWGAHDFVLTDLVDVTLNTPSHEQVLQYDNATSLWKNETLNITTNLASLTDTNISGIQDDDILRYDSASGEWKNEIPGYLTSSNPLSALSDVAMYSGQSSGDVLAWDGSQWDAASGYLTSISGQSIEDLSDVGSMTPSTDDVLYWNGSSWMNSSSYISSADSIEELVDVNSMSKATNDVLYWTGSAWSSHSNPGGWLVSISGQSIEDLSDVGSMTPSNADVLYWTGSQWSNLSGNLTTSSSIKELTDVDGTMSPSMNDVLYWDGSNWDTSSNYITTSSSVNALSDVNSSSPSIGDVLSWNGTYWQNNPSFIETSDSINVLSDVSLSSPQLNEILSYNSTYWVNTTINSMLSNAYLNDLGDVSAAGPSNNDYLKYSSGSSYWESSPITLAIGELTDVSTSSPNVDDGLKWTGSQWEPSSDFALNTDYLSFFTNVDSSTDNPGTDGYAFYWSYSNTKWMSGYLEKVYQTNESSSTSFPIVFSDLTSTGGGELKFHYTGLSWQPSGKILDIGSGGKLTTDEIDVTQIKETYYPSAVGSSGQFLKTDGSTPATLTWDSPTINITNDTGNSNDQYILWNNTTGLQSTIYHSSGNLVYNPNSNTLKLGSGYIETSSITYHSGSLQIEDSWWPSSAGTSGQVLTTDGGSPTQTLSWADAASNLDSLSDVKYQGTNFDYSLKIGSTTTGGPSNATYNTFVGYQSGDGIYDGDYNTYLGANSGYSISSGTGNTGIGHNALTDNSSGSYNTAVGYNAGYYKTGTYNTFIGAESAANNNSAGNSLTYIGYRAGYDNHGTNTISIGDYTTNYANANYDVVIGSYAGHYLDNADYSVFIGYYSGYGTNSSPYSQGDFNTAIGYQTLRDFTSGYSNTTLGYEGLRFLNTGYYNTTVGYQSGLNVSSGYNNLLLGYNAGSGIQSGYDNTILGDWSGSASDNNTLWIGCGSTERISANNTGAIKFNNAFTFPSSDGTNTQVLVTDGAGTLSWGSAGGSLDALSDGMYDGTNFNRSLKLGNETTGSLTGAYDNIFIGYDSGNSITDGYQNTAVGAYSLNLLSSQYDITAIGFQAGKAINSGFYSTIIGSNAGSTISSANYDVYIGCHAGENNSGEYNIAIGHYANAYSSSSYGVAVGYEAGRYLGSADYNTLVGYQSGFGSSGSTDGDYNVGLGYRSLAALTTGYNNLAVGTEAGVSLDQSFDNTMIGYRAGYTISGSGSSKNTFVGNQAGYASSSSTTNNTAIGYDAGYSGGGDNNIFIGYQAGWNTGNSGDNNTIIGNYTSSSGESDIIWIGSGSTERISVDSSGGVQFNNAFRFPTADGSANQVLETDGAGTVSWATASGGGGATDLNGLSDVKAFGTDFADSIKIGSTTTGTLSSATKNILIGTETASLITSADSNVAIGYQTFNYATTSDDCVAIGVYAGQFTGSAGGASHNTFVGQKAGQWVGYDNSAGERNTAVGSAAMYAVGKGDGSAYNVAVGYAAMGYGYDADTAHPRSYNTAIGYEAAKGSYNSGYVITEEAGGTYLGYQAGYSIENGDYNTMLGYQAGYAIESGSDNIFIGKTAGNAVTTGSGNTIIGDISGTAAQAGEIIIAAQTTERISVDSSGGVQFNQAFRFPTADGSANQVLETDGSGQLSWATGGGGGGGMSDVVDDTTPQLGGDLDVNGFDITSSGSITTSLGTNNNHVFNINQTTANTSTASNLLKLYHTSSGTVSAGFGTLLEFGGKNPGGGASTYGHIGAEWEGGTGDPSGGALVFKTDGYSGGSTERLRISSEGVLSGFFGAVTTTDTDADYVLIDDGGTMKKITPANLGVGGGGGGAITALNNATENELVTVGSTTTELDAEAKLTYESSTDILALSSTDASSLPNPTLQLIRDSASPTFGDLLGVIQFKGENQAGTSLTYGSINGRIQNYLTGQEEGLVEINALDGGSLLREVLFINGKVQFDTEQTLHWLNHKGTTYETTLDWATPTADRTVTFPDATGTVLTTANSDAGTTTTSSADADHILVDDGGVLKKITPGNLGIGGGGGGTLDNLSNVTISGPVSGEVLKYDGSGWVNDTDATGGGGGGGITTGKAIAMAMVFG